MGILNKISEFRSRQRQETTKSPGPVNVRVKITGEFERTMTYISFILKPCDLKFGMHVVKTLPYFIKAADYTYDTHFLIF